MNEQKELLEDQLEGLYDKYCTLRKKAEAGQDTYAEMSITTIKITEYSEKYHQLTGRYYVPKKAICTNKK